MAFEYLGHSIPETHEERLALGTALVVVDLQRDFVDPAGHCAKTMDISCISSVVSSNARLISLARRHGIPVIYTFVTQHAAGSYASPRWIADNLRYPDFDPVQCIEDTWGWELHDDVASVPADIRLRKYRRSAFVGTNLVEILRSLDVETLIVSGVAATGCVESTVRDAIEHDYFVIVPADCIGDATADLVAAACTAFDRMLLPGDLTNLALLTETLERVDARPQRIPSGRTRGAQASR
jgi:ureidoacrylate peracid hydrolase